MASTKPGWRNFLLGVTWLLFAVAGFAFWFGGGLIHALNNTDRTFAEMEGIGLAVVCGAAGAILRSFAEDIPDSSEEGENTKESSQE